MAVAPGTALGPFQCRTAGPHSSGCCISHTPSHSWGSGSNCSADANACSSDRTGHIPSLTPGTSAAIGHRTLHVSNTKSAGRSGCHTPHTSMPIAARPEAKEYALCPHPQPPSPMPTSPVPRALPSGAVKVQVALPVVEALALGRLCSRTPSHPCHWASELERVSGIVTEDGGRSC